MTSLRPTRSIRFKISLVFGVTFLVGFAGAATYVFMQVRDVLILQDNRSLIDRASRLAERTSVYPLLIPLPAADEVVALTYSADRFSKELYRSPNYPKSTQLVPGTVISQDTFRLACLARSMPNGYGKLTIVVGRSNQLLTHQLNRIGWLLGLTLLASMILSGLGAWWLSGWLLQPLRSIIDFARSVNQAEQLTPIPVPSTEDEFEELAKTINDMLARIQEAIDTQHLFFAAASHELRTPLSILRTEVELAQREATTPGEQLWLASHLTELRRLSRLVDDLLAMSQLRAGTLQLRNESVDLTDLTLLLAERYHRAITARHLFLSIDVNDHHAPLTVVVDRDKLTNVLLNLLDNAVKYATTATNLELWIGHRDGQVVWSLTNQTTRLIPNPDRLLSEFYQADQNHDGYGLGLWISYQVVRLMKGALTLSTSGGTFCAEICFDGRLDQ